MGRHRRAKVVLGARSTVVKAAAAMGVATALAVGVNSAAHGPTGTQAAADTTGDPVAHVGDHSAPDTGHTATSKTTHQSVPTGFATESAGTPKLIQQTAAKHAAAGGSATAQQRQAQSVPAPQASQPAQQPSSPSGSASAPSGSDSASSAPAPSQSSGTTTGGQQGQQGRQGQDGGLLGTVVGTVGGVVGGLLG